jgi:hypothetical protein
MTGTKTALQLDEKYERLSDFYLRLWKQLDLACGDANWLQIRPVSQIELRKEAETILAEIHDWLATPTPFTDGTVLDKDFKKTQELVDPAKQQEGGLDSFRDYLRDLALRYSQLAEESSID